MVECAGDVEMAVFTSRKCDVVRVDATNGASPDHGPSVDIEWMRRKHTLKKMLPGNMDIDAAMVTSARQAEYLAH